MTSASVVEVQILAFEKFSVWQIFSCSSFILFSKSLDLIIYTVQELITQKQPSPTPHTDRPVMHSQKEY